MDIISLTIPNIPEPDQHGYFSNSTYLFDRKHGYLRGEFVYKDRETPYHIHHHINKQNSNKKYT